MSAEIEGTKRVRDALDFTLKPVLDGFVEANMKAKHGNRWLHYASRTANQDPGKPLDMYGLLKTVIDNWAEIFSGKFDRKNIHKARSLFSIVFEARNATAHLDVPLSDPEALNYLWNILELARLLKAPEKALQNLDATFRAQRGAGPEAPGGELVPPPSPAAVSQGALVFEAPVAVDPRAPKPWTDVALPHLDVIQSRFRESEFAADLFAVDSGKANDDYAVASNFFRITFLTEGLKRVLSSTLQRLARVGGDPVIGLQTSFGGGKTHTMLAAYHLAKSADLGVLPGVLEVAAKVGVTTWSAAKVAVFVGTSKGTDVSLILEGGPKVRTLWGYIAWHLAGDAGLALVAESERAGTNPGSELMVEVLRLAGPCLILLDEVVTYARQLPDDRFEALLSFIQSLTEAVKMVPGAMIIGSIVESHAEAGGPKGQEALLRLDKVFGRVQSPWLPASDDETYEIICRRLFQPLDEEGVVARDATVKAFHDLYRKNADEFPREAREQRYLERMRLSYPIHPELLDRLSRDWASLPNFQKTRSVLRFMANVIGVLWQQRTRDPMITPARVPISHEKVRASVLYPLDPAFSAVVDKEVDGDASLPYRMEANTQRRISKVQAATRAARAVFLCTAPLVGQPNAGLTGQGLRLACAEPNDQLAIFGDALREMSEQATYLYDEGGRYWFSTQPTLNRLADERAKALADHTVDAKIAEVLRSDAAQKGGFAKVHAVPDDPTSVEESPAASLVILAPATAHLGRGAASSAATEAVGEALIRRGTTQRRFRNTLFFVAADEGELGRAREVMRKAIAWRDIADDKRLRGTLKTSQIDDAEDKAKSNWEGAQKATRTAWSHVFYPVRSDTAGKPFELEHTQISSRDRTSVPSSVYEKVAGDGILKTKLGPVNLWNELSRIWPEDRPWLPISDVADWFASHAYLAKLKDRVVLELAIKAAVLDIDPKFAYAESRDEANDGCRGLVLSQATPEIFSPSAVIVKVDEAKAWLARHAPPGSSISPSTAPSPSAAALAVAGPNVSGLIPSSAPLVSAAAKPTRFYGSVDIDPVRPVRSFEMIFSAVVAELQRSNGVKVKLTLDIEITAPDGFEDSDVSVVRDNARQLKFTMEATGFD